MSTLLRKAIQLVEIKDGKLEVNGEALEQLQKITEDKPVTVVSLIGKYRSGKSTLLNDLIGQADVFCAGHGTETVTKGVWCDVVDKPDKYILYLDVQGHNDPGNTLAMDKLLLWCFSASSEIMYNNMGAVSSETVKELYNLAKFQDKFLDKRAFKPHLRLLLRDFTLDHNDATEYVREKLTPSKGTDDISGDEEKAFVSTYYQNIKAYAFVAHPDMLERSGGLSRGELKKDLFAEKRRELEEDISTSVYQYTVGNEKYTLKEWCTLVSNHLREIINGAERVDLSESWMNGLHEAIRQGILMMRREADKEASLSDILEKERNAWSYVCDSVTGNVTTFISQKWKEEVKDLYDLKRISDHCLERIQQVEMMEELTSADIEKKVENGDEKMSLNDCLEDKKQLWNIPSDGRWFGQLCRNTLREVAGRKQLKIKGDMKTLSESTSNYEEQIVKGILVSENLPERLWMHFENWKNIRETTTKQFKDVKDILTKSKFREQAIKISASAGGMVAGAGIIGGIAGVVSSVAFPPVLLGGVIVAGVFGTAALIGGKGANMLIHKGVKKEQLDIINEQVKYDQDAFNDVLQIFGALRNSILTEFSEGDRSLVDLTVILADIAIAPFSIILAIRDMVKSEDEFVQYIDGAIIKLGTQSKFIKDIMVLATLQKIKNRLT